MEREACESSATRKRLDLWPLVVALWLDCPFVRSLGRWAGLIWVKVAVVCSFAACCRVGQLVSALARREAPPKIAGLLVGSLGFADHYLGMVLGRCGALGIAGLVVTARSSTSIGRCGSTAYRPGRGPSACPGGCGFFARTRGPLVLLWASLAAKSFAPAAHSRIGLACVRPPPMLGDGRGNPSPALGRGIVRTYGGTSLLVIRSHGGKAGCLP